MKRLIDISVSFTALLVLTPIMLMIAAIIKLESKGPVLYGAARAGKNYKKFNLLKFRTMHQGADKAVASMKHMNQYQNTATEDKTHCTFSCHGCVKLFDAQGNITCEDALRRKLSSGVFFKVQNDPRITRFGKFLRNTSLDELPQLINVLRGDMSLVGNRPLPLYEAEKLTSDHAAERFLAPAGITGLWQVTKRGKAGVSEEERIELDKQYARDHSLKTDIKLMIKTVPALLQSENV